MRKFYGKGVKWSWGKLSRGPIDRVVTGAYNPPMNKTLLAVLMFGTLLLPSLADAATKVHGYTTKKGTYVPSYYRSNTNKTKLDNYSTKGNINPYTGKRGYKSTFSSGHR